MTWLATQFTEVSGRSGRLTFLAAIALALAAGIAVAVAAILAGDRGLRPIAWLVAILFQLGPTVRRLHDLNAGGWAAVALFVPGLGFLVLVLLLALPGTPGPNRWGPPR